MKEGSEDGLRKEEARNQSSWASLLDAPGSPSDDTKEGDTDGGGYPPSCGLSNDLPWPSSRRDVRKSATGTGLAVAGLLSSAFGQAEHAHDSRQGSRAVVEV